MPDRGLPTSKGNVMSSKPAVTAVVLALLSTSAFAQSAAPPNQTPPTQAAPPSKTPPAKTPPATQPAPPAETPTPETAKPAQSPAPKPTSTTGRRPRAAAPQTQVVTRDVSGSPLEGVTLAISGAGRQEATTNASGIATLTLPDGQYRFSTPDELAAVSGSGRNWLKPLPRRSLRLAPSGSEP